MRLRESAATPPTSTPPPTLDDLAPALGRTHAGVLLTEQVSPAARVTAATGDGGSPRRFRADVAVCDIINRNYAFYPRSAYEAANERAARDLADGKVYLLLEHPDWDEPWRGRLHNVAGVWQSLGIEEREMEWPPGSGEVGTRAVVVGEGYLLDNPSGNQVRSLLEGGAYVGISTNAEATVTFRCAGDLDPAFPDPDALIPVISDDLTYLTIDAVSDPANVAGRTALAEHRRARDRPVREEKESAPPQPAPNPTPPLEDDMHPKLKKLLESLGKSLEQVKRDHPEDYTRTLEAIADEKAPGAEEVAGLREQVGTLTTERDAAQTALAQERSTRVTEGRTRMVDEALAAANLPKLPPLDLGGEQVDLNASFRAGLLDHALRAESEEAAKALVDKGIALRRHELAGHQPAATAPERQTAATRPGIPAPSLPVADHGREAPMTAQPDPTLANVAILSRLS